jgi:hypothetical protein
MVVHQLIDQVGLFRGSAGAWCSLGMLRDVDQEHLLEKISSRSEGHQGGQMDLNACES